MKVQLFKTSHGNIARIIMLPCQTKLAPVPPSTQAFWDTVNKENNRQNSHKNPPKESKNISNEEQLYELLTQ